MNEQELMAMAKAIKGDLGLFGRYWVVDESGVKWTAPPWVKISVAPDGESVKVGIDLRECLDAWDATKTAAVKQIGELSAELERVNAEWAKDRARLAAMEKEHCPYCDGDHE